MTGEGNPVRVLTHPEPGTHDSGQLDSWLQELVSRNGSDLLLVAQASASMRVEGSLVAIGNDPLSHEEIEAAVLPALAPHARQEYEQNHVADSSYRIEGRGRFRINLHRERGRAAATVRALPSKIPTLDELRLPPGIAALAKL
jgi:twitching motility protein PilT